MLYKNILFINFILPVVSFNTVLCMTIFQAASKGDLASMQTLLEQNIYVNQVNERGESPLHIASKNGRFQLVDYLLKHGVNIRLKDLYGRIALHYAVLNDHVYITEQLLKYTSNPNEQDDFGFSPLHLGSVEFLK
jgi:ankyrin repeat protein